jgi:hypothetical protein
MLRRQVGIEKMPPRSLGAPGRRYIVRQDAKSMADYFRNQRLPRGKMVVERTMRQLRGLMISGTLTPFRSRCLKSLEASWRIRSWRAAVTAAGYLIAPSYHFLTSNMMDIMLEFPDVDDAYGRIQFAPDNTGSRRVES